MLFSQVSRKEKGPAVQPSTQHGKGPLREAMGSLMVFSTLKPFFLHTIHISYRPMPSPKMSHQGLFGCVTPDTLNTMKLHLLPMTLKTCSGITLEVKTSLQSSQEYPVSPEWVLIYLLKDLVLAKPWQHNSQEASPG